MTTPGEFMMFKIVKGWKLVKSKTYQHIFTFMTENYTSKNSASKSGGGAKAELVLVRKWNNQKVKLSQIIWMYFKRWLIELLYCGENQFICNDPNYVVRLILSHYIQLTKMRNNLQNLNFLRSWYTFGLGNLLRPFLLLMLQNSISIKNLIKNDSRF